MYDYAYFSSYLCISGTLLVKMLELQYLKIGVAEMGSFPIHDKNSKAEKACDSTSLIFSSAQIRLKEPDFFPAISQFFT